MAHRMKSVSGRQPRHASQLLPQALLLGPHKPLTLIAPYHKRHVDAPHLRIGTQAHAAIPGIGAGSSDGDAAPSAGARAPHTTTVQGSDGDGAAAPAGPHTASSTLINGDAAPSAGSIPVPATPPSSGGSLLGQPLAAVASHAVREDVLGPVRSLFNVYTDPVMNARLLVLVIGQVRGGRGVWKCGGDRGSGGGGTSDPVMKAAAQLGCCSLHLVIRVS